MVSRKREEALSVVQTLAEKMIVPDQYEDLQGELQNVPAETRLAILAALGFPGSFNQSAVENWPTPKLDVAEGTRCYMPPVLPVEGMWGISAQVYELRSSRNWGIGDFEDVKSLCTLAAEAGADFVGLNPLHALFQAEPKRCSPYSPSNRRFLNPLYLAVDKLPNFDRDLVPQEQLARARECELVDYPLVSQLKLTVLRQLWQRWNESDADDGRFSRQRFTAFLEEGGDALRGHCLFEALSFHMTAEGYGSGWQSWPSGYHDCTSDEVQAFAAARGDEIQFHAWLQWLTALQLEEVAAHAKALRMRIGLYLDFAVGEVPDGSSTWSKPELVLPGIHVGAPPDAFSAKGQDWGLVPLSPVPLLDAGNAHYKDLVDRTARYAGALRLDHVLGLWQLFLIPEGETAAAGGYMRYPFKEVMGHLAVVSQARQTIIVGEDLGNVPVGFRPALKKAGALGYRVLYFENVENDDLIKNRPPSASLTCLSTHDLPPLTGWWAEDDIDFAQGQGWCDGETATRLRAERTEQKSRILQTLRSTNLLPAPSPDTRTGGTMTDDLLIAVHRLLAKTDSLLVAVRLADMIGERRSTNIPGTFEEYPNWRVKLATPIEDLPTSTLFLRIAEAQRLERPTKQRETSYGSEGSMVAIP